MAEQGNNLTSVRDFLLGKLSPEMQARVEESFLNDDEVFEEIEIAEDELVDAYVRDELSARDRDYFEQKLFRVPRIAARVEVARVLARSAVETPVVETVPEQRLSHSATTSVGWRSWLWPTSPFGKFAFAGLGLIVILGSPVLIVDYLRLREATKRLQEDRTALERRVQDLSNQSSQSLSEQERLKAELEIQRAENARLNDEVERQLDRPVQPSAILSLTLFTGGSRAVGAADSLRLQVNPAIFQFNLLLETSDYPSYKAVVSTLSGKEIGRRPDLKSHSRNNTKLVTLRLSSLRFTPGEYLIHLSGTAASGQSEPIATYTFRVLPKTN